MGKKSGRQETCSGGVKGREEERASRESA